MRAAVAILPLLYLVNAPLGLAGQVQPEGAATSPSAEAARRAARWAEYEADRRLTHGDYEGAFRAQATADADRRAAERLEMFAQRSQSQKQQ